MNERIKELWERAVFDKSNKDSDAIVQNFAELIVRECASIAKQTDTNDGDDYKSGRVWAGIDILKHFNVGVES